MKRRISSATWPESRKCFASVGCALLILVLVVVLCCSSRNVKLKKKKFSPYHYYIYSLFHIYRTHTLWCQKVHISEGLGLFSLSPYTQNHSISNFMQQETFHKMCWIAVPNFCSQVHSSSTISFTWLADCTC